ncbi:MAG: hypothetical protein AAF468_15350 [Pseudomonadota bacterium]
MSSTTIADIIKREIWLHVTCERCRRSACVPWRMLERRVPGRLLDTQATQYFRCDKCKKLATSTKVYRPPAPFEG